jgi:sec-independent protein translocase protein TatB
MDFGLSWSHMLLVLVVALVVVGPKDLPKLMRKMGQWTAKARGMADQFRRSFDDMARQSELDELRKELDELRNTRPLAGVEQQFNEALTGPSVSLDPEPAPETAAPADPAAQPAAAVEAAAAETAAAEATVATSEPAPAVASEQQPQTGQTTP